MFLCFSEEKHNKKINKKINKNIVFNTEFFFKKKEMEDSMIGEIHMKFLVGSTTGSITFNFGRDAEAKDIATLVLNAPNITYIESISFRIFTLDDKPRAVDLIHKTMDKNFQDLIHFRCASKINCLPLSKR